MVVENHINAHDSRKNATENDINAFGNHKNTCITQKTDGQSAKNSLQQIFHYRSLLAAQVKTLRQSLRLICWNYLRLVVFLNKKKPKPAPTAVLVFFDHKKTEANCPGI